MRSTTCFPSRSRTQRAVATLVVAAALLGTAVLWLVAGNPSSDDTRWRPQSGDAVIAGAGSPIDRELRRMHRALRKAPNDPELAAKFAQAALQRYAEVGDARLVGRTEAALAPWRGEARPPLDIWRLKGRLLQNRHRFSEAADNLELLLASHPEDTEARLLAADASRRLGRIDRARVHCLAMALNGNGMLAGLCAAEQALAVGNFQDAGAIVSGLLESERPVPDELLAWALAIRGDAATARAEVESAVEDYRASLQAKPTFPVQLALADALITGRLWPEAESLLSELPDTEPVILRRAMLARQSGRAGLQSAVEAAAAIYSGDPGNSHAERHYREKALFHLYVDQDIEAAISAARINWKQQKGWEDGNLLLRAAIAGNRSDAARPVVEWRHRQQKEPDT